MITKIIILAIICSLLSVFLKPIKPEYSLMIGITFTVVFAFMIINPLSEIFTSLENMSQYINGGNEIIQRTFKIICVSYACEITSEISKSAGETAIAKKIEIAGKIYVAYITLPVFNTLLGVIKNVL